MTDPTKSYYRMTWDHCSDKGPDHKAHAALGADFCSQCMDYIVNRETERLRGALEKLARGWFIFGEHPGELYVDVSDGEGDVLTHVTRQRAHNAIMDHSETARIARAALASDEKCEVR